jgi:hypothetical protein
LCNFNFPGGTLATVRFHLVCLMSTLLALSSAGSLLAGMVTNVESILTPSTNVFVSSTIAPASDRAGNCESSERSCASLPDQPGSRISLSEDALPLMGCSSRTPSLTASAGEYDPLGQNGSGSDQESPQAPAPGGGNAQGMGSFTTTTSREPPVANLNFVPAPISEDPSGLTWMLSYSLPHPVSPGMFRPPRLG